MRLAQLAKLIQAQCTAAPDINVVGVASLLKADSQHISFFSNSALQAQLNKTQAAAVIIKPEQQHLSPVPCLLMADPYLGYGRCMNVFYSPPKPVAFIHPTAWLNPNACIGKNVYIGAKAVVGAANIHDGVYIGEACVISDGVVLGAGSRLLKNVTLMNDVCVGQDAIIHPGAVIGADGFALANDHGQWLKIPQIGTVIIGNQVEIGANTTIDRGALDNTVIEDGVKLDNQIQIAHNVHIGQHTAIAACVGIAGSTRVGAYCTIGGGVGMVGHIEVVDNVHITGGSVVLQSILEAGVYSSGSPLQKNRLWRKNYSHMKNITQMAKDLKTLKESPLNPASSPLNQKDSL